MHTDPLPDETPTEARIDEALKDSFPASDPPPWTLGDRRRADPEPDAPVTRGPA